MSLGRLSNSESQVEIALAACRLVDSLHGCIADAERLSGDVRVAEIPDFKLVVAYPAEWFLAEETLTPNLGGPLEVFSLGSFPLRPGGPTCAQIPSQALHDLRSTDVFVTVQERGTTNPSVFDPRPDSFGPTAGDTDHVFYECLEPEERADVGTMHWIWLPIRIVTGSGLPIRIVTSMSWSRWDKRPRRKASRQPGPLSISW